MAEQNYFWRRSILRGLVLMLSLSGCLSNLCQDAFQSEGFNMQQYLHTMSEPKGALDTGIFDMDDNADDHAKCLMSCCEKPLCNMAWFTQTKEKKCFLIECADAELCHPINVTKPDIAESLLIEVRSFEETSKIDECQPMKTGDCQEHMHCDVSGSVKRCKCNKGYIRQNKQLRQCVKETEVRKRPQVVAPTKTDVVDKSCEVGLLQCGSNADCVPKVNSKSKVGTCQCREGFVFDSGGKCVSSVLEKTTQHTAVHTTSVVSSTGRNDSVVTPAPKNTTPKIHILTVSAGDNKVLQLPDENQVTLKAFVLQGEKKDDTYHFDWSLEAHPENAESGTMEGKNTDTLKLSHLIAGLYTFRVQVTGTNEFGEAYVNVTVNPPKRQNQPPVAIIKPTNLQVKLPNSAILDGSDSTDDEKIISYRWEEVSGPLRDQKISGEAAILSLKDLTPGNYTFKLTVTDSDGATNSTTASVTAIKETDYPPKANAGSDVVIHLPQNSVILYGNLSTDDKGIESYEWIKSTDDKLAADMQGARESVLHLSNLEVGDYTFTLKVTDKAGQSSSADVHVYVKPEQNTPPVAVTMPDIDASLPLDSITLDGSNSTDDQGITAYLWQQTGGPTVLAIKEPDKSVTVTSGTIKVGKYTFMLTVKDKEELKSSATLTVTVKKVANEPPDANAGGNHEIQLPQLLVTLDGSKSSDDHKITDYLWLRDPKSLAAGDILNNSDHQAVLQLVNVVAGQYIFTLTVKDAEGLSSKDTASVIVKGDKHMEDKLELLLDADIKVYTEDNRAKLEGQLALLLPKSQEGEAVVHVENLKKDEKTGNLRVKFYAMNVDKKQDKKVYRPGREVLSVLKKKLLSQPYMLEYKVVWIDTVLCQNNCSNHGHCDQKTKECVCEAFWMQNIFTSKVYGDSNCDWSILYVVIVCFMIVIAIISSIWGCVCFWKRRRCRCRVRTKRRHRYSLLEDMDDIDKDKMEMKKGKIQNSSVMISESDFSSEEETIFMNPKKSNGHLPKNGLSKPHYKTKLKT